MGPEFVSFRRISEQPVFALRASARQPFLPGKKAGGADRDRTDDLKLAKLALSQLSYGPEGICAPGGPGTS
jgi:hypothetical protein